MAKSTVSVEELADVITQSVAEYTEDVSKAVEKEVDKTALNLKNDIKRDSPVDTGEYQKGWSKKKKSSQGQVNHTIYNKNKPGLVHLLEFGFTRQNGTRQSGQDHIRTNYEKRVDEMNKNIEKIIKEGG